MVDAAKLKDLITRVEAATEGSSHLNEAIAEALLGVKVWKSKHGYWNVSFPSDWPYGRAENITMPGRRPDEVYDASTGEKLPKEAIPTGWSMDVDLPEFTASIDAALALVERVHGDGPGYPVEFTLSSVGLKVEGPWRCAIWVGGDADGKYSSAPTPALAICLALLRSIEGGERG